ncbi:MAG: GNAT family N-acetyltransferase [Pseudomonadales bacterium]
MSRPPTKAVIIRPAMAQDLARLQAFAVQTWLAAFAHTYRDPEEPSRYVEEELALARFAQALGEDAILLALERRQDEAEELLGYVQIGPARFTDLQTDPGDQDLRRLYVAKDAQGRGIGHQLMDAVLALVPVCQARRVFLDVWEHNHGAQKLYRSYGFKVIARRRYIGANGQPEDEDYQMCRLQPQ